MTISINQIYKSSFILIFLIAINSFSQEKPRKHKIRKGETITSIAKENNVSVNEIFALNPDAKKVLKLNSVLLIPFSDSRKEKKSIKNEDKIQVDLVHQVAPKETLYGIAKKYKISIDNLKKWNPILENSGLEIGQIINVAENKSSKLKEVELLKSNKNSISKAIIHEVLSKETLYSLSKKFNISIQKLEELNPEIKNGLPIGFKLIIKKLNSDSDIKKIDSVEIIPKIETEKIEIKTDSVKIIPSTETIIKETETQIIAPKDSLAVAKPISNPELPESLAQRGSEHIGTRYHSGGTKPGGFDCSGLMIYIFENSGVKLPRTSADQSRFGKKINKEEAQKGDLIFFSTNGRGYVNHVGMVVDNIEGEIKFIHASIHSGVTISSLSDRYYQRAFKHINHVLE